MFLAFASGDFLVLPSWFQREVGMASKCSWSHPVTLISPISSRPTLGSYVWVSGGGLGTYEVLSFPMLNSLEAGGSTKEPFGLTVLWGSKGWLFKQLLLFQTLHSHPVRSEPAAQNGQAVLGLSLGFQTWGAPWSLNKYPLEGLMAASVFLQPPTLCEGEEPV